MGREESYGPGYWADTWGRSTKWWISMTVDCYWNTSVCWGEEMSWGDKRNWKQRERSRQKGPSSSFLLWPCHLHLGLHWPIPIRRQLGKEKQGLLNTSPAPKLYGRVNLSLRNRLIIYYSLSPWATQHPHACTSTHNSTSHKKNKSLFLLNKLQSSFV